jgi:hypothetical protein
LLDPQAVARTAIATKAPATAIRRTPIGDFPSVLDGWVAPTRLLRLGSWDHLLFGGSGGGPGER